MHYHAQQGRRAAPEGILLPLRRPSIVLGPCILLLGLLASAPVLARPPARKAAPSGDKSATKPNSPPEPVVGKDLAVGVGLTAGSVLSGLSAKLYVGEDFALQLCAGVFRNSGFGIGADATLEARPKWAPLQQRLFFGGGVGAAGISYTAGRDSATLIGLSAVVEVGWQMQDLPLEFVIDARPTWVIGDLLAGAQVVSGGGSIRWYF